MMPSSRYSQPSALELRAGQSRSQTALAYLKVDGLRIKYVGPGEEDSQAATIRTNYPAPLDVPIFLFEVQIVNKGQSGFIGIGYQTEDVILARLPGWEPHSYGYHGDDGHTFSGSGEGRNYGPPYSAGDTIGAMLCRVDMTIRFFLNGRDLGDAFRNVSEERLYPCVGLRTRGEEVVLNLGRSADAPFVTDISTVVATHTDKAWQGVSEQVLPLADAAGTPLIPRLLHDHLLHHRCWHTAAVIQRDLMQTRVLVPPAQAVATNGSQQGPGQSSQCTGGAQGEGSKAGPQPMEGVEDHPMTADIASRQASYELVSAGRIEEAMAALEARYGATLLVNNPQLAFQLKVAQFCELLRPGGSLALDAAVNYGRSVLAAHSPKGLSEEELLGDALSLLAYEQPEACPCGHLMGEAHRAALAEKVDRAVLAAAGYPARSALERLLAQAVVATEQLKQLAQPQALLIDARKLLTG